MVTPSRDPRVVAIRADPLVGRGSLSDIDETFTDDELIRALDEDQVRTPAQAVRWARDLQQLFQESDAELRTTPGFDIAGSPTG